MSARRLINNIDRPLVFVVVLFCPKLGKTQKELKKLQEPTCDQKRTRRDTILID